MSTGYKYNSKPEPTGEILPANQPAKFEARNMRPKFRRLKAGDIFLAEIEIEESVWNQLRTVPENALLEVVLWHHDGDPDPAVKPEKTAKYHYEQPDKVEKGEWGTYWQQMFKRGFQNYPDLIQVLNCAGDQIRLRLHDVFSTDTLTTVSPTDFERFLESEGLTSLVTLSRQAQASIAELKN